MERVERRPFLHAALHDNGARMLNINGITVRLGGRTILDRASASLPPKSRVGLIGRNGAGKSTLMKVMIGSLEADEGEIEMPRKTRIGYIAQEAPSGQTPPIPSAPPCSPRARHATTPTGSARSTTG